MLTKFNIVIAETNLAARGRLREVLKSVIFSGETGYARNLQELTERIQLGSGINAVFISSSYSFGQISDICRLIAQSASQKKPLVIVNLKPEHQGGSIIGSLLGNGVSGFICEPYSSEALQILLSTSQEFVDKDVGQEQKEKAAQEIVLKEASMQLDGLVRLLWNGDAALGPYLRDLKRNSVVFKEWYAADSERYTEMLCHVFLAATTTRIEATFREVSTTQERRAPHPGQAIGELMQQRGISLDKLHELIKIEPELVDAVIGQQTALTELLARELARVLGKTAAYWMGLQHKYTAQNPPTTTASTARSSSSN